MTLTLEINPDVQAELTRRAIAQGRAVESYAAILLEEAVHAPAEAEITQPSKDVLEAIERLRDFGKNHGLSLGDMTIRELRHEARP
jgi:hypothetical protein